MGLWDIVSDAIKDLPVAEVRGERLAFAKEQAVALERENADLKAKVSVLEAKVHALELDKAELQEKVRHLEEQLSERRRHRLEPIKEHILGLLKSTAHLTSSRIAQELQVGEPTIQHHLEGMQDARLVDCRMVQGEPPDLYITPEGHQYLATYGLL